MAKKTEQKGKYKFTKADVDVGKLKKYLLNQIDTTNLIELSKLDRFISLIELNQQLLADVALKGGVIDVENGQQKYTKTHPAIAEINKINTSLLSIEKSFIFKEENNLDFNESDFT